MTIPLRQLLLILGGTLLAIGLALGFTPISHDGGPCGSAFGGDGPVFSEGLTRSMTGQDPFAFQDGCTDARSGRLTLALALALPGALLCAGAFIVGNDQKQSAASRS